MYRIALFSSTVIYRSIRSVTASTPIAYANAFSRSAHHLSKTNIPNLVICASTASSDALKKVDRKITKKPEVRTDLPDLPFKSEDIPEQPIIPCERKVQREKDVRGGGDDDSPVCSYHYNPVEYVTDDKTYGDAADGGGDVDGGGGDCGGGDGGGDCGGF